MKKRIWIKMVVASVVLLLIVLLMIQNRGSVQLTFLLWKTASMPQSFVLAITFALGLLCGFALTFVFSARARKK